MKRTGFLIISILLYFSCSNPLKDQERGFEFSIVDVGQGLCQIGASRGDAIIWDLGPPGGYEGLRRAYKNAGMPQVKSIVISHRDLDHSGGLSKLDTLIKWSGLLITSKYEDTSYLRSLYSGECGPVCIRTVSEGDTIGGLDDVSIRCIWPPDSIDESFPVRDEYVNRYSLAFLIQHFNTQVVITSDIDSVAQRMIAVSYGTSLKSDIAVVAHHGSAGSVSSLFSGYVGAELAVISCSRENQYGHPHEEALSMIMLSGSALAITSLEGTINLHSNGYYFVRERY
ncbi:MAG TPA: hypothetical protein PLE24_09185 [Chitinispirillaceae bacterium]|jgi:competence protein ComEC|nr:hypothetical protein [Chitinispirillaceae bacterium]